MCKYNLILCQYVCNRLFMIADFNQITCICFCLKNRGWSSMNRDTLNRGFTVNIYFMLVFFIFSCIFKFNNMYLIYIEWDLFTHIVSSLMTLYHYIRYNFQFQIIFCQGCCLYCTLFTNRSYQRLKNVGCIYL